MKSTNKIKDIFNQEHGGIAILTAISLSVIIGFTMIVVDGGILYTEHKRLQYASDAAALAGVRKLANHNEIATHILNENKLNDSITSIDRGIWVKETDTFSIDETGNAVRVRLQKNEVAFFSRYFLKEANTISAQSIATLEKTAAVVSADSSIASVDSTQSPLLNAILGGMLDSNLNLSVGGWNKLIQTKVDLVKFMDLAKVHLGSSSTKELLDTDISLAEVIDLYMKALGVDSLVDAELDLIKTSVLNANILSDIKLKMGDIINLNLGDERLARADIGLLSAVTTAIELFNSKTGITNSTNISIPLLSDIGLNLQIINPPPMQIMQEGSSFKAATVQLSLDANALGLGSLGNVLNLSLYSSLGGQTVTLTDIQEDTLVFDTTQSLVTLGLGSVDKNNFFNWTGTPLEAEDVKYNNIVNLLLLEVRAKAFADAQGGSDTFTYEGPFPETQSSYADTNDLTATLISSLLDNLKLEVNILGLGLGLGKSALTTLVKTVVSDTVSSLVSPILANTLKTLGISLGETSLTVHSYAYKATLVK